MAREQASGSSTFHEMLCKNKATWHEDLLRALTVAHESCKVLSEWKYGQAAIDLMKISEPREYVSRGDLVVLEAFSMCMNDAVKAVRGDNSGVEQADGLYPTPSASDHDAFSRHCTDPLRAKV